MKIIEIAPQSRDDQLIENLVELWENSVRATHLFLTDTDITSIRQYVPEALKAVPHLLIAKDETHLLGFIGLDGKKIEMFFIASQSRGKGIGKKLLQKAVEDFHVDEVVVNEQNSQARGFYEHMGFEVVDRSETDEQGGPFPILYMKKID